MIPAKLICNILLYLSSKAGNDSVHFPPTTGSILPNFKAFPTNEFTFPEGFTFDFPSRQHFHQNFNGLTHIKSMNKKVHGNKIYPSREADGKRKNNRPDAGNDAVSTSAETWFPAPGRPSDK